MVFGAFELVEMLLLRDTPHDKLVFLHLSRGITLTLVLISWVSWTLFSVRDRYEHVIRSHEAQFRQVLDQARDGILIVDEGHNITYCNKGSLSIFEMEENQILGHPITELQAMLISAKNVLSEGIHEYQLPNGSIRFLDQRLSILKESNGSVRATCLIFRDITDRRIREADMQRSEQLASLGRMAAGVAHEIGNPLSAISSIIQLLQRKTSDANSKEPLKRVRKNIDRITRIVRDMVDFSRPKGDQVSRIDVHSVISDSVGLIRHDARAREICFELDLKADYPMVKGIPDQLHQVFLNILVNAVDALKESPVEKKVVRIKSFQQMESIIIAVFDNGTGIGEEIIDRIFEPFFTTKEAGMGTGLGLSVSFNAVKNMDGILRAFNTKEGGACFEISLPLSRS